MDPTRELYWRHRLRRIQLDAKPIAAQVERQRRTTIALTLVLAGVGSIFLAIFAAFDRPDIGAVVVGVLIVPMVALAWIDFARLQAGAKGYLREREDEEP